MDHEGEKWKKRFEKERMLRKNIEQLLEEKTRSLFEAQQKLDEQVQSLNNSNKELQQTNLRLVSIEEELRQNLEELQTVTEDKEKTARALVDMNRELESLVEERTGLLKVKQDKLVSSINYAKRIQDTLLPNPTALLKKLPNSFLFHQPKDIVSGDFLWYTEIDHKLIVAVIDCTGHGVPGAFMSLVANEALFRIINGTRITAPDIVLNALNFIVKQMLGDEGYHLQDGMDIGICSIDLQEKTLDFAGAKRSLIYIQNDELIEIKGDRAAIGWNNGKQTDTRFHKHSITIQAPTTFYLFSDGFPDQFGGTDNRKYMIRQFKKLLQATTQLPLANRQQHIAGEFNQWKGNKNQTDDVMVLGFDLG